MKKRSNSGRDRNREEPQPEILTELKIYKNSGPAKPEVNPDPSLTISRLEKSLKGESSSGLSSATGEARTFRINQYLARAGFGSRRETESIVNEGRVELNGNRITTLDTRVRPGDIVSVDGKTVRTAEKYHYVIMNKPAGYVVSKKGFGGEKTIYSLLPQDMRSLKYAGRLDRESRGLLLLSDDGDFIQAMTHPSKRMTKRYLVTVNTLPAEKDLQKMFYKGVVEGGELLRAIRASVLSREPITVEIILGEGKKRHIRRMFKTLGIKVTDLFRAGIGFFNIEENPIEEGHFMEIDPAAFIDSKTSPKKDNTLKDFNPWKKKV
jgi:23S rRNA pseudouridine2605 synthase